MANAKAKSTTKSTAKSSAKDDAWAQRYGTLTKLVVRQGKNAPYAILTIDCGKFEQTAMAFGADLVDRIKAVGEGKRIWVKGPIEQVSRKSAEGGTYSEESFKVIYFRESGTKAATKAPAKAKKAPAKAKATQKATSKASEPMTAFE